MDQILRIKRPDTLNKGAPRLSTKQPNRIPWVTYYVVPCVTEEEIGKLFKTAWVIFPNKNLIQRLELEWLGLGRAGGPQVEKNTVTIAIQALHEVKACILVPTYITSKNRYAFQFSRRSFESWMSNFGDGFGKFYFLQDGKLKAACSYCPHNVHFMVHECSPGTESCRSRIKKGNQNVL
jgi:hypothetical protein